MAGAIFENYVVSEIHKMQTYSEIPADCYFYRTNHGAEVDLIVDRGIEKELIEIKKSHSYKISMTKQLKNFPKLENTTQFLLYQGDSIPDGADLHIWHYKKYLKRD